VISASIGARLTDSLTGLRTLARLAPLALAGPGAVEIKVSARVLQDDPLTEADRLTRDR
jgi:hypothetical protein